MQQASLAKEQDKRANEKRQRRESFALKSYEEARASLTRVHQIQVGFLISTLIAAVIDERSELINLVQFWKLQKGMAIWFVRDLAISGILFALIVAGCLYAALSIRRSGRLMATAEAILNPAPAAESPQAQYFDEGRRAVSRAWLNTCLLLLASLACFILIIDLPEYLLDPQGNLRRKPFT